MKFFDVVVIGGGSAGFSAAQAARARGASVCLIEKGRLGGECPNFACVPSKALLRCAKAYRHATHAAEFGVLVRRVEYRFSEVMAYKDRVVGMLTGGGERGARYEALAKELGIDVVYGQAVFEDARTVRVERGSGEVRVLGKSFVIAAGTVEFIPPVAGLEKAGYWTFRDVMKLTSAPKSLLVLGGGPVGVELATFFGTFGIPTTLVHNASSILNREDEEIAVLATSALRALGVEVLTNARVGRFSKKGKEKGVEMILGGAGERHEMRTFEHVLIAAGKRAATDALGLQILGVKQDEQGNIVTSARQQSSAAHIFAAGDIDGGLLFTHTAHYEGHTAGTNAALFAQEKKRGFLERDERVVPRVTFLEPEVASVGQTQAQVEAQEKRALVGRLSTQALGRSLTDSAHAGLIKIIAHPKTREVLGGHMIGPSAGEVMHEVALAMQLHATIDDLASLIHAFPTYAEAVVGAASSV